MQMKNIITLCILLGFSTQSFGFEVDQTYFQMSTKGLDSKHTLTLKNDRNEKRFITVEVLERTWNSKKNTEERLPTQDLKVSEKSLVLQPNTETKLTLDWAGAGQLKTEKAYRVIITEVKNQQKENVGEMKAPLVQYITSVFVTPENAKDDVKLVKSVVTDGSKVEITLTNSGNKHKLLSESGLLLQDGKDKNFQQKYTRLEAFQQLVLMPGQTKTIVVPTEMNWKNKKVTVSILNE